VGAGLIGFLVVLGLFVASVFLFRSMTRHLRNVPKSFEPPAQTPAETRTEAPTEDPPPTV
jgi:hypothetical protein